MIFITGDCHGNFERLINYKSINGLTKKDYIIVCGDFGYFPEATVMNARLNALDAAPFTTLFIDGNHEDFHSLESLKEEEWMGGRVHYVRDSVIHLMRGESFSVDGKKIFAFGGARSMDIRDGLINLNDYEYGENDARLFRDIKSLERLGMNYRVINKTWWKDELPSKSEMTHGLEVLEKTGAPDIILTHCAPGKIQERFFPDSDLNYFTEYLDLIRKNWKNKRWFFGHYHRDLCLSRHFTCIYTNIVKL